MKKVFLFLTMLLFAFTGVMRAGVDVEVGMASSTNSYLPDYTYYDYAVSQQIYTASEIGMGGTINAISFDVASGSATRSLKVYMKHVTKSVFGGTTASEWAQFSTSDVLFEGNVTWAAGWVTITLDTPFEYNGTDNLLVCVQDATGSYVSSQSFRVYSSSYAALRAYRDGTPYDISNLSGGSRISYKNHIKLNMELGPANITATPNPVELGLRPNGAWMRPGTFTLNNGGNNATVTALETNNSYFTVNSTVPFAVNFGEPVEVEVTTGTTNAGEVTGQLMFAYSDRTFGMVDVTATAYDPVDGDVAETAIVVNEMPFQGNAPQGIYKNYVLPVATEGADAVYKVTFDEPVLFSAGTPGDAPAAALYTEDFNGVGGPDAENNYVYNGPQVNPGPTNMWFSYAYTGSNTWYGTSAGGGFYFGYNIPVEYIAELGLAGTTITTVEAAAREAYPYECFILEGGSNPDEATFIGYGAIENTIAQYFFDINLEVPAYVSGENNIWVMFYSNSPYAAYCGKNLVDVNNAKIWTYNPNATSPAWSSNTTYTPVIYTRFIELPTGRETTVNLAEMNMKKGNGVVSEIAALDGAAMGTPKAEMKKANRGNRDMQTVFEEGFEGGSMPTGWTTTGSYWTITSGTGNSGYTGSANGSYNAGCNIPSYSGNDDLITPAMDLSEATSATLTFNFWNTNWGGDINTLNVYYSTNGSTWNLLESYDTEVSPWASKSIALEGLAANYQIRFQCVANYSYGMGIDDVVVTADITSGGGTPEPPTATYQIEDMYVPAGTYYLAVASTTDNFQVDMAVAEVPVPEQAIVIAPNDGETFVEAPYLAEWILGDYTAEMQVLVGTQYPPQTALIDWTDELVESAFLMDLENNQTYFMQVNCRNAAGTTEGEIYVFSTPIDPVEGFAVETEELYPGDAAVFTWNANRTLQGYNLYMNGEKVNEAPIAENTYSVEGLEYNMDGYSFQITAVYDAGESMPSNAITVYMTGEGSVNGHVYDTDVEHPIAGATVIANGADQFGVEQTYEFTTDENGFYEGELLSGQYLISIATEGYENEGVVANIVYNELTEAEDIITHEFYYPLGMITAAEEEAGVNVEWSWTPAELVVDFETGDFSQANFVLPTTYPWTVTTTNPHEGTYCMKSTCEGIASGTSEVEVTVDVPYDGKMGFWVRVSSEANYDKFHFFIDGVEKGAAISGQQAYAYKEFDVTEGTHTYKWQYAKDSSVNSNDDCAYVDDVTLYRYEEPLPPVVGATTYDFDDDTMMGWTSIDADNDGNGWVSSANPGIYHNSGVNLSGTGHNESEAYVISGSYANQTGAALTPDNYLVSPAAISAEAGAQIQFWACAQDASYAAEHFGVAVSTTTATAAAFTTIQEWTMTAKGDRSADAYSAVRGTRQGTWYQYSVDLSAYAGQDIWVAIRHFNCTDMFILNVDDITLATGGTKLANGDRTFQSFNLYRRNNITNETPELIVEGTTDFEYVDAEWATLPYGEYQWGVAATYEGYAPVPENRESATFGFEGGLEGWTGIVVNTAGGEWIHSDDNLGGYDYTELAHTGTGFAMCYSYVDYVGAYDTDAYLVSPQKYSVDANSSIAFWADNANDSYPENFSVCVATAANPTAADFTEIWSGGAKGTGNGGAAVRRSENRYENWRSHNVSLAAYAGQEIWIAFHDVNYDAYEIWIDDVTITYAGTPGPGPGPTPGPTGSGISEILWSNVIEKDMTSDLTFNVSLNNGQNAAGVAVTVANEEHTYTATVDETGVAELTVRKGVYDITVAMTGYVEYLIVDEAIEENTMEYNVVLNEIVAPVDGLYVSPTGWAMWEGATPTPTPGPGPQPGGDESYDFDDATMMGWTTIDANNDGYDWVMGSQIGGIYLASGASLAGTGHNSSADMVCSGSYSNATSMAITPDNYLVSPNKARYSSITFYACAQDASYAAEHYGVAVSTAGNTSASDFTMVQEWTMTSKGSGVNSFGRDGQTRAQGSWYEKTVDLSAYAGQDIYVAIRHFNCNDQFILNVDDVTLTAGSKDRAPLYYKVMCDNTYLGETEYPFYQMPVEGMEEGSEHTTAVAAFYATGMGDWMSYDWTYAPCSNYAGTTEYNVTANGNDVTLTWTLNGTPGPGPQPGPGTDESYDFEDGTFQGWTTIDANNDGYDWVMGSQIGGIYLASGASLAGTGHNSSADMVCSGSYSNATSMAITPDNYLVSPNKGAYQSITFYACAQDASYAAEHYGVAVSTGGATASEFTMVQEWTMTAKGSGINSLGRDGQTRAQGSWYEKTVDLSAYAGQQIWVAIRHFNCNDQFILNVDDITLTAATKGEREMWDLVYSFQGTSGYQYGVATDGNNIYTSSWSASSTSMFYKYDMQGNFVEEFNISGCGQLRGMTYDGEYFYGVANSSTVYCVDLANQTLVASFSTSYGAMRCITYDPVRDGFWVVGNWSGNLTLIDRTGAIVQTAAAPTSASDVAYYKDSDDVEHIYYIKNESGNGEVYEYNITTGTMGSTPVYNCLNTTGGAASWTGSSGGCFVAEYDGKMCFFADAQQSPQLINIYELSADAPGPGPGPQPGNILGVMIWRDGEPITMAPVSGTSYVDAGVENGEHEYCVRVVYSDYAMSCDECETVEVGGTVVCDPVTNLTAYYYFDATYGDGAMIEWDGNENAVSYGIYVGGQYLGSTTEESVFLYGLTYGATYTLGIVAEYANCESEMVTIQYTHDDGVEENAIVSEIYPNPTSGNLNIKATAMTQISIYNAMGQMVYSQDVNADEMVIDMSQFEAGVYMVNIITENGSAVKRITVVK
ncbi:MAG: choice-of-anchor J domain-containing protein [Bacteroidales bacterium]|nr:choice-of-anchor J domain-containing protein [Bacteroidales bacterium]